MKHLKIYMFILFIGISVFLVGCTYSSDYSLILSFNEVYLQVGENIDLDVSSNEEGKISFRSLDPNIAMVDENGMITALSNGETKIAVSQGDKNRSCLVYVGDYEPSNIYILSNDNLDLSYGDGEVNFKVIFDKIVANSVTVDWYLNNQLYQSNINEISFIPNEIGDYEIYAQYKSLKSNILHFSVKSIIFEISANNISVDYLQEDVPLTYKIIQGELCYDDVLIGELEREQGNNAGEYKITQGSLDIINKDGKSVISNYNFIFNEGTYAINKIAQEELDDKAIDISVTSTSITIISELGNLEYSLDGETWQVMNVFTNLTPDNSYFVYIRIQENENYISSNAICISDIVTLKQFVVSLYAINGIPGNEEYVLYDTYIYDQGDNVLLELYYPKVEGYTFDKYRYIFNNEELITNDLLTVNNLNQNINVYAIYNINIYNVTFISYDSEQTYSFKYLDQINLPTAGEKIGYVFTNWVTSEEDVIDSSKLVASDLVLTANYEIKNYIVAFYNQGKLTYSEVVAAYDKLGNMPENPYQEGYIFVGWNTKSDGSGTYYYSLQDLTKIKEDLYLFAIYKAEQFDVTYLDYDGSVIYEEKVNYGEKATYDNIPKRDGYIFIGWSVSLDKITSNIEVYAQYQLINESEE